MRTKLEETLTDLEEQFSHQLSSEKTPVTEKPILQQIPTEFSQIELRSFPAARTETVPTQDLGIEDEDLELDALDPMATKPKPPVVDDELMDLDLDELDPAGSPQKGEFPDTSDKKQTPAKSGSSNTKSISSILSKSKKLKPKPAN